MQHTRKLKYRNKVTKRDQFFLDVLTVLLDGALRDKQTLLADVGYNFKDYTYAVSFLQLDIIENYGLYAHIITPKHRLKIGKCKQKNTYQLIVKS